MRPCVLYQRLCQQLRVCAPQLGVWPTRRLALLVTGLLLARHTALPRLAAQLRRVTPTAHTDSIERRLRRILAQTEWNAPAIFEGLARAQATTTIRTMGSSRSSPRLHLGELVTRPGGPNVTLDGWVFSAQPIWAHTAAVWRVGHQEAWLLVSNLDLGKGLAKLYAQRMQIESLFRDAKSGGFEWELSRV